MFYKCAQVTSRHQRFECTFYACRDGANQKKLSQRIEYFSFIYSISMENNKFKYENFLPVHTRTQLTWMHISHGACEKYDSPMPFVRRFIFHHVHVHHHNKYFFFFFRHFYLTLSPSQVCSQLVLFAFFSDGQSISSSLVIVMSNVWFWHCFHNSYSSSLSFLFFSFHFIVSVFRTSAVIIGDNSNFMHCTEWTSPSPAPPPSPRKHFSFTLTMPYTYGRIIALR